MPSRTRAVVGVVMLLVLAFGGYVKGSSFLSWAPLDITVMAAAVVALLIADAMLGGAAGPRHRVWLVALPVACMAGLLAVGVTDKNDYAAVKSLHVFVVAPLCVLGGAYLLRGATHRRYWCVAMAVFGLVVLAVALVEPSAVAGERLASDGGNTIGAGRATGAACVVLGLAALTARRWRLLWLAGAVLAAWGAFEAASRGPLGAAAVAIVVAVAATRVRGRFGRIVTVGVAAVALAVWSVRFGQFDQRLTTLSDASAQMRGRLWQQAGRMIPESPLGVGWGRSYDETGIAVLDSGYTQYPHNIVLEVFSEGGWLAGVLLLVVLWLALRRQWRLASSPAETILLGLLVFAVVNAMVSGDVNTNRGLWVALGSALAGSVAVVRSEREPEGLQGSDDVAGGGARA